MFDLDYAAQSPRAIKALNASALVQGGLNIEIQRTCCNPIEAAFRDLALKAGLALDAVSAVAISPDTAAALAPLVFREVRTAAKPDQDHILKLLD